MATAVNVKYKGGQHTYTIPFEYLEPSFVKVELNGILLTSHTDYDISERVLTLYRDTKATDELVVYRKTETTRLVQFHDGAVLREKDLTTLQLQLLHVIEEQTSITLTQVTQNVRPMQMERTVKLANGVSCARGTLLGYKAGGFIKATQRDYTTLQDVVIALESSNAEGYVKVLERGQFGVNDLADGKTVYVGEDGAYRTSPPNNTGDYVKTVGTVEGNIMQFHPDSLAIQLA